MAKKKTPKQLANVRKRIITKRDQINSCEWRLRDLRQEMLNLRVAYLKATGWEVISIDRYGQRLCRLTTGSSGWCGIWEAEKRQRKRERAASRRASKTRTGGK